MRNLFIYFLAVIWAPLVFAASNFVQKCNFETVSTIETTDVVYGVAKHPNEKVLALGTYHSGLTLVDIADPTSPTTLSTLSLLLKNGVTPADTYGPVFSSDGNTLFICGAPFVFIVDVSNVTSPSIITTIEDATYPFGIALSADSKFLYVADWDAVLGIRIYDVQNASFPVLVKTLATNGNTYQAVLFNNFMATASDVGGAYIVKGVDSPSNSSFAGNVPPAVSSKVNTVAVSQDGKRMAVGLDRNKFQFVNIENPASPQILSTPAYDTTNGALYTSAFGDLSETLLYFFFDVGAGFAGIQVFQRDSNDNIIFLNGAKDGESVFAVEFLQNKSLMVLGKSASMEIVRNCKFVQVEVPVPVNSLAIGLGVGLGLGIPFVAVFVIIGLLYLRKQKKVAKKYQEMGLLTVIQSSKQLSDIKIEKAIREGHFGQIYVGSWQGTTTVVLKKLKQEQKEEFEYEVKVMSMLNHPHVVHFLGIFTETIDSVPSVFMVMEFLTEGSLDMLIMREKKELGIVDLLSMAKHAAAGLKYLESQQIVHRDIALRNLLVTQSGKGKFVVKVADFGMARILPSEGFLISKEKALPIRWSAPEVLSEGRYSSKSDVFSFGVLLWELFSFAEVPWGKLDNKGVKEKVLDGEYLQPLDNMPSGVQKLMNHCFDKLDRRYTFEGVYKAVASLQEEYLEEAQKGGEFRQSIFFVANSTVVTPTGTGMEIKIEEKIEKKEEKKETTNYAILDEGPYTAVKDNTPPKHGELKSQPSGFYSAND